MPTKQEFISSIKTKYPQYKDIEDDVLFEKITTKYPQYLKQINESKQEVVKEVPATAQPMAKPTPDEVKYGIKQQFITPEYKAEQDKIINKGKSDQAKIWGGGAVKIASPLVGLGLAPFTGGMSIPASLAIAGGAEGLVYGLGDTISKDLKGVDAVKNTAKEAAFGTGIGAVQGAAIKVAPKVINAVSKNKTAKDAFKLATNPRGYTKQALKETPQAPASEVLPKADTNIPPATKAPKNELPVSGVKGQSKLKASLEEGKIANKALKEELGNVNPEYDVITNKETVFKAQERILKSNPVELAEELKNIDKVSAEDVTVGRELIRRFQDEGNYEAAVSLAETMAVKASEAGQAVQALSLWSRLTPEGALRYANRIIGKANEKLPLKKQIKMNEQQAEEVTRLAKNIDNFPEGTRDRDLATAQLLKYTAELVPPKIGNQLKTVRNISLLLNPKTLARNVLGNTLFAGAENVSRAVATPIDMAASLVTGQRSRTLPDLLKQVQGFHQGGKEGFEDALLGIDTRGDIGRRFDIPQGRAFRSGTGNPFMEALNKLETGLDIGLRVPDRAQYQAVYNEAIENMKQAQGLTEATPAIMKQAHDEALQAVFQNDSAFSRGTLGVREGLNNFAKVGEFGLGDMVMPYAQTPANLAMQGLNYSPVGALKSIANFKAGNQRQATMDLGRSLVGTGIMGLGYAGANSGNITGDIGDKNDYETRANEALIGNRPQSIYFGDTGFGFAPLQPMSIPLSVGAALAKGENPLTAASNTLLDLPFMQGVQQFQNDLNNYGPVEAAINAAGELPGQFIPTGLSQINQLMDNTQRETSSPNKFIQAINKSIAKVPGLSQTLPARYDVAGQPAERYQDGTNNAFNVLLNPVFSNERKQDPVISNLSRLNKETGETKQYFPMPPRIIKIDGENRKLTGKEKSEFQRLSGELNYKFAEMIINDPELDDYQKIDEIQKLQEDVSQAVKFKMFNIEPTRRKSRVNEIFESYLQQSN